MSDRVLLNGLVDLLPSHTAAYFYEKFQDWVAANEWTYHLTDPLSVPDELELRNVVLLNSSVFQQGYPVNDENSRYYLRKIWDPNKSTIAAFMMNPSAATELTGDSTVDFLMEYVREDFGSLIVVNTSPLIKGSGTTAVDFRKDPFNWFFIKKVIQEAEIIILGWGENGQKFGVPNLPAEINQLLIDHQSKLRAFEIKYNDRIGHFPAHPHPQMKASRYNLSSELVEISQADLESLLTFRQSRPRIANAVVARGRRVAANKLRQAKKFAEIAASKLGSTSNEGLETLRILSEITSLIDLLEGCE